MTPAQVLAGAAVLVTFAGIVIAAIGVVSPEPASEGRARRTWSRPRGWAAVRLPVAVAVGLLVAGMTRWPVLAVASAGAVVALPRVFGVDRTEQQRIARIEAVEEFARRLADVLAMGMGLEQAIQTAARTAPAQIQAEVATLSARLAARMPTEPALRLFADDLDDAASDLVVASLILASRRRGPGVASSLSAVAQSVGDEVAARRRIESDRAKPRTTAKAVTLITIAIVTVGTLNRNYAEPYSGLLGQVVLAGILIAFGAALWWMHSMTLTTRPGRLLSDEGAAR